MHLAESRTTVTESERHHDDGGPAIIIIIIIMQPRLISPPLFSRWNPYDAWSWFLAEQLSTLPIYRTYALASVKEISILLPG
jgi:hypothetical protein